MYLGAPMCGAYRWVSGFVRQYLPLPGIAFRPLPLVAVTSKFGRGVK